MLAAGQDPLAISSALHNRVIIHADLDSFYAQVEVRRIGADPSQPLAVRQWDSLIAVNYPARAAGVRKNGMGYTGALAVCPNLTLVHVSTLDANGVPREGEVMNGKLHGINKSTDKVTLHRYRTASKSIFKLLVEICGGSNVEKAGIDEAFIDVTELATSLLRTGVLKELGSGRRSSGGWMEWMLGADAPSLPPARIARRVTAAVAAQMARGRWMVIGADGKPVEAAAAPTAAAAAVVPPIVDLSGCALADADTAAAAALAASPPPATASAPSAAFSPHYDRDTEEDEGGTAAAATATPFVLNPDIPSEARMAAGAVVASYIRFCVYQRLGFTMSAGVCNNKMLAKIGSGRNKPNKQTVIPLASVAGFMGVLPLQSIRS